ncbi:MAG: peptide chain release factor 2 [Candidatus Sumerlaeia bacterium]
MREIARLKQAIEPWDELLREADDHLVMAELLESEGHTDGPEAGELAREVQTLARRFEKLEFQSMLSGEMDPKNCYLHIHAGAGGTESCDWAGMLLRMYTRWAERQGFDVEEIELNPGEEAGVKSVTLLVKGPYAYGYLKAETGVHRLVRISPFDANKRRHTSFASVYASPEIDEDFELEIPESDLRIDTFRSGGHGGQHINVTDSAVRIVHLPTRITVSCQNERSQYKNKVQAMKVLRSRLYEYYREKQLEEQQKTMAEKTDIGWGHQIRSYVFAPYQLVKDLRTNVETGNVEAVMDGEIDMFIEAWLKQKQSAA